MPKKASKAKQRSSKPSTARAKKRQPKKKVEVRYKYDKVLEEGLAKIADLYENMFR